MRVTVHAMLVRIGPPVTGSRTAQRIRSEARSFGLRQPRHASRFHSFLTTSAFKVLCSSILSSLFEPSSLAQAAVASEGSFIFDGPDVRLSTGVSLIWQSPLGPLRADVAQALLKASYDRTEIFRFGASTNF